MDTTTGSKELPDAAQPPVDDIAEAGRNGEPLELRPKTAREAFVAGSRRKKACDECYRRKIICEGFDPAVGSQCKQCATHHRDCIPRQRKIVDVATGVQTEKAKARAILATLRARQNSFDDGDYADEGGGQRSASFTPSPSPPPGASPTGFVDGGRDELSAVVAWSLVDLVHRSNAPAPGSYVPSIFQPKFLSKSFEANYLVDVVFATTVALGARFSLRPSVAGKAFEPSVYDGSSTTINLSVVSELGQMRQRMVEQLRNKALRLAEEGPVFDAPSYVHFCLLLMLYKLTLFGPWDHIRIRVLVHLHRFRTSLLALPRLDASARAFIEGAGKKILLYDAQLSIILQASPMIDHTDLRVFYGWTELTVALSYDKLNIAAFVLDSPALQPNDLQQTCYTIVVHVLRMLAADPFDPAPSIQELPKTLAQLSNLRKLLEMCHTCLSASSASFFATLDETRPSPVTNGMHSALSGTSALLIQAESALAHHTEKLGAHFIDQTDLFDARESIDSAQLAFIRALKVELTWLGALKLENLHHVDQQENAARLLALDAYPRWLETTLVALNQRLDAEGPLSMAGFDWNDLKLLQRSLCAAGAFDSGASIKYQLCVKGVSFASQPSVAPPPRDPTSELAVLEASVVESLLARP